MRLGDVIGQDLATAGLRRAVAARHVPHAYLFEGPPGVGKRSAALGLAMALCCGAEPGQGCGICEVCRRIGAGLHPDVPTFATDGPLIVLEQAQTIVALAQSRPHEAPVRVIIIDDADRLNLNAANCLLKTLEEPAAGTHIVLVTSAPDRILPTIRSRTQRVRFSALPAAALVEVAVARGAERERAQVAAALADGSVARTLAGAGISVAATVQAATKQNDEDADPEPASPPPDPWAAVAMLQNAAYGRSIGALFDAAVAAAGDKENKQELPRLLALLARLYRDALAAAAGAPDLVLFEDRVGPLAAQGLAPLSKALEAIVEADTAIAANTNAVTAVERMLLVLRRCQGEARS
ncbi:MAG TPA: DNA polymerase III subunit delta' [Polyangia bacterium]|jgi:DNA polymerase-3 subunit delta'|nr:DNA polymerase III subunit delta' [Polyangia bacterium]